MKQKPFRLTPSYRDKIWGVTDLEPWFRPTREKTGEVWFLHPEGERLPILVKFIFTSDRLSVQVHPPDDYAWVHDGIPGKTEMWHILRAEPGASLALGFGETIAHKRLREASLSGEIEHMLRWFPVSAGETYFIPPGTVHALGAGIALVEIQENSDNTYRLYDYGRPRELHLDKAIDVSLPEPHPGPSVLQGNTIGACKYFVAERYEIAGPVEYQPGPEAFHLLIVVEGHGSIGEEEFTPGEVWMAPRDCEPFPLTPRGPARLLRTWPPQSDR